MKRVACSKNWEFYESEESNSFVFQSCKGEQVDLPHDFIIGKPRAADAPGGPANGYFGHGEGVYKKVLEIPADWEGKTVLIDVDGAYMNLEIMLNSTLVGMHPYGYTAYQADLTQALRFDGRKNRLKLITQSRQPSTRWYSGGGLYRDVCLWVGGPVHVEPWDVFVSTPEVSGEQARVHVEVVVTDSGKVDKAAEAEHEALQIHPIHTENGSEKTRICRVNILDADGKLVASREALLARNYPAGQKAASVQKASAVQESRASQSSSGGKQKLSLELVVDNPKLWDLDDPYLYTYQVCILEGDEELDSACDIFGIRKIEVDAVHGFRLNGTPMNLKGGCVHHDNGFLGACAYPKAEERKMRILKNAGYNTIRMSHYPPSLALLKICDRMGMLVMDEAYDVWRLGKMPMDYHLYFEDWWDRDIAYMVRRDRNHPCVITYSIGNEITERDGRNDGAAWSKKLAAKVREYDNTRAVISAICGVFPESDEDDVIGGGEGNFDINLALDNNLWDEATRTYCEPLDIVGYNYLKDIYESSHTHFPDRVMLGTETHSFLTYEYWQKVEQLPYVIGDCIWAAVDYLGEVGVGKVYWEHAHEKFSFMTPYPWRTSWQSDIDLTGEQRPQSVYREIMWGNTAKSGMFTTHPKHFGEQFQGTNWHWYDVNDTWTFEERWIGKPVRVDVYGAGDEAEWILNGTSLGCTPFDKLIATMDIAYEPGVLESIIYREGQEISRCRLVTVGAAASLELVPEEEGLCADGLDLAYVRMILRDAEGNRLTDEESAVRVKIDGPGTFLAVGSGNPCTEDQITADHCHLYRGTAIVIFKSSEVGEIRVTAILEEQNIQGSCTVMAR